MSEHAGEWEGDEPLADAEVGVAETGRHDPDEDLAALRIVDLDRLEDERLMVGGQHGCGGGRHELSSV